MEELEIKRTLNAYLMYNQPTEEARQKVANLLSNPEAREFIVKNLDNYAFWALNTEFGLSEETIKMRQDAEKRVLNNFSSYSEEQVKESLCGLLFHDNKQNTLIKLQVLRECAESKPEFMEQYKHLSKFYGKVEKLLQLEPGSPEFERLLREVSAENKEIGQESLVLDLTNALYIKARRDFIKEVNSRASVDCSRIFQGIEPGSHFQAASGESVGVFELAGQTTNQENFVLCVRSTNISGLAEAEDPEKAYKEIYGKYPYLSYSIFDEETHKAFVGGKGRVVFGFSGLGNNAVLSSTVSDGQTNQYTLTSFRQHIVRQTFVSVDDFMLKTGVMNEVVVENKNTPLPTMIISSSKTPPQEIVDLAAKMHLPIVYISEEAYKKSNKSNVIYTQADWYSYPLTLKEPLENVSGEDVRG